MANTRKVLLKKSGVSMVFEVNPASISVNYAQITKSTELLSGEYMQMAGKKLRTIQLETFIPHDDSYFHRGNISQQERLKQLLAWKEDKSIVTFSIEGIDTFSCYITAITKIAKEGDRDIGIQITVSEARTLKKVSAAKTNTRASTKPPASKDQSYTVVKGDALYKISKKFYGDQSKWRVIYDRNKSVIGGNPNKIYPGQKFIIPAKTW